MVFIKTCEKYVKLLQKQLKYVLDKYVQLGMVHTYTVMSNRRGELVQIAIASTKNNDNGIYNRQYGTSYNPFCDLIQSSNDIQYAGI